MTCDFFSLATPGVRALDPYQPGKPIEELAREYGLTDIIKLASNENPLGPSPLAIKALQGLESSLHRYPDGGGFVLKKALAERLGVAMEQITLGNGSNDVLELAARAFATPETEVIFSEHAFAVYPIVTQAVGAKAVVTPAKDWGHDPIAMAQAVTDRTRLIFIANPNNPTGTWVDAQALRQFLKAIPPHVLVVVDEAYFEYVDAPDYPDCLTWLGQFPNLIVTRTFSKIYGLAGLRVGYAVSHPDVANLLNRVRQPFNVNSLALSAATAALNDEAHVIRSRAVNRASLEQLSHGLTELGLRFIPSVGNFITVEFDRPGVEIYQALLRQGVIVRPVANYGMPNHLRVTVGLEEENTRFLKSLAQVVGR
jgi:histidinol-phosphate aminotransferase